MPDYQSKIEGVGDDGPKLVVVDPPAPVVRLRISHPRNSEKQFEVDAILDTGAYKTCVPWQPFLQNLPGGQVDIIGATGSATRPLRRVKLHLPDADLELEVIVLNKPYALLGRDILNRYKLTLDGPSSIWTMEST